MPWWGIVLVVLFADWTAMFILGRHLTKQAEKAVTQGTENVKSHLLAMVPQLLAAYKVSVQAPMDAELEERTG